jgi:hypothetical protein
MKPVSTPIVWSNQPYSDGKPYIRIEGGCGFYAHDGRYSGFQFTGLATEEDARRLVASFNALLALPLAKVEELAEAAKARLPKEAAEHVERRFEAIV